MSPNVTPLQSRRNRPSNRVLPVSALFAGLICASGCATTQQSAPRAPSMQLTLATAAHHRFLTGQVPAVLAQGPVSVSAHVFTQPGSLVSVFAKTLPSPDAATFALDVRIPQALMRQPLLVRVSGPVGFYQTLVMPEGDAAGTLAIAAMDDKTTVIAQIYVAARASQSWPRSSDPAVLTPIISMEMARAVRQAPNAERTLAAVTQGVVAAVCAWQAVLSHQGLARTDVDDSQALVASLEWHTSTGQLVSDASSSSLQEARSHARCVDCTVPAAQLALAAQAGADAWLVYADKLPWALRSQALVDAAALQAHFMLAMVAQSQDNAANAVSSQAAAELEAGIASIRHSAPTASPTTTARCLSLAWQRYAQAVWQSVDADEVSLSNLWAQSTAQLQAPITALRLVRSQLNSRVAPAQTAASMASVYVRVFLATQSVLPAQSPNSTLRLSAALTLRSSLLVAAR